MYSFPFLYTTRDLAKSPKQKYSINRNLVPDVEPTIYILSHCGNDCILVCLKGDNPKFCSKDALERMGWLPSSDFYLDFEIKDFSPVPSIDPNAYELERKGQQRFTPYFTL